MSERDRIAADAGTEVGVQPVQTEALPAPREPADAAAADRRPILELRNVSTHYGMVAVLRNVDVEIHQGEMVCLLGGNASGKTTTLKTILGYVEPSEGDGARSAPRILAEGHRVGRRALPAAPRSGTYATHHASRGLAGTIASSSASRYSRNSG